MGLSPNPFLNPAMPPPPVRAMASMPALSGAPPLNVAAQLPGGRLPTPEQLLAAIKPALSQLLAEQVRVTVDTEKLYQYSVIRRSNLYARGKQNLTLSSSSLGMGIVDYRPVSSGQNLQPTDRLSDAYYDAVLNFYRGDLRAFIAVLGARSPNAEALAHDPTNEDHTEREEVANQVAQYLRSVLNVDDFHRHTCYGIGIYGTMFSYARYISNPDKWGYTSYPRYTTVDVPGGEAYYECPYCGTETPQSAALALAGPAAGNGVPPPPGPPPGGPPPAMGPVPPAAPPLAGPAAPAPGPGNLGMVAQPAPIPVCRTCGRPLGPESLVQPPTIPALIPSQPLITPNGGVELSLCGPECVTTPFWCKDLDEVGHSGFLAFETMVDPGAVLQAYPELRARYQSGTDAFSGMGPGTSVMSNSAVGEMGQYTRDMFASPTGYVVARRRTSLLHSKVWYPTAKYEIIPNDKQGVIREILYKMFPRGLEVTYVNNEPIRLSSSQMTRKWAACKPEPSDTIHSDPYFDDYIQASDVVNDCVNMIEESAERSMPLTVFDPNYLEPDRLRDYANLPGELIPASASATGDFSKAFYTIRPAEIQPALVEFVDKFIAWTRDVSGITPTLWGAIDDPTAHGTEIRRNQAMGRLNTVWSNLREFHGRTLENCAYQLATFSDGRLFTSKGSPDSVEVVSIPKLHLLLKGGWRYWIEEAMPMTPGQRRDWYMQQVQMAAAGSPLADVMGLTDPGNLKRLQETIGTQDWHIKGIKERRLINGILGIVAKQPPLPPPPVMMGPDGVPLPPPPPQPNSPFPLPDLAVIIPPVFAVQVSQEWANSDSGQKVMMTDYQGGWQNVLAWIRAWQMMAMPPPMPGPGAPGPGGPEGPLGGGPPPPEKKGPPPTASGDLGGAPPPVGGMVQ